MRVREFLILRLMVRFTFLPPATSIGVGFLGTGHFSDLGELSSGINSF